jgi:hypothetical protein
LGNVEFSEGSTMTAATDTKLTYGFWGAGAGAAIAMTIGFVWGGWTTSGTTQKITDDAVLTSRAAICVAQFMSSANQKTMIKAFQDAESYQKAEVIEKGGWDKMPGDEKAAWGVSQACATGLEARIKTGI